MYGVAYPARDVWRLETATPFSPLFMAVGEENPAEVSVTARGLQAHQVPFVLQGLERRQRALHVVDQLAGENLRCPELLLLDSPLPGLDTRERRHWIKARPVCRRLRMSVMTGSDAPDGQAEVLA